MLFKRLFETNQRLKSLRNWIWGVLFATFLSIASANVIIEGTRVVYKQGERDVTVKLTNTNTQKNALVQVWLDDGNATAAPEESTTPFIITPPLAKIPAGRNQAVRITFVGDKMKQDRETLYWFNVLEIPPKSNEPNVLSFAIRTRIKFFYRPKSISTASINHGEKTEWHWKQTDKGLQLELTNNAPTFLSYFEISAMINNTPAVLSGGGMVNPFDKLVINLNEIKQLPTEKIKITLKAVNDFGGESVTEHLIDPVK